jgi:predicted nucleotidyltransferase
VCYEVIMATVINPVLQIFRAALEVMYGKRIERVVLYGSQARGDARPDSDYDVAVFLKEIKGPSDRWAEADRIALAAANILNDTGAVIHVMPYRADAYFELTPLMHEIRREGLEL